MDDRVEKFVDDFERALESRIRRAQLKPLILSTTRGASQLADLLDEMKGSGLVTRSVTSDDLRSLNDELQDVEEPAAWQSLLENARALMTVLEDGIVDGDVERLRSVLARADTLPGQTARVRGGQQPHLPRPVRVTCTTCDDIVVGRRREGALNWNAVTKSLRDHERSRHGGYSDETRDALRQALERLRAGEETIEAGRYVLVQV